jgi:hypothetical protein
MGLGNTREAARLGRQRLNTAGSSALRVAMLFGSIAVAIALIAVQVLDNRMRDYIAEADAMPIQVDRTTTGSISYKGSYTIRRSVLQGSPGSVCILRDNGTRSGDC